MSKERKYPGRDPASENLLDRLLYKAVLPRYAFPTDVAAFHVFDQDRSTSLSCSLPVHTVPRTAHSRFHNTRRAKKCGSITSSGCLERSIHRYRATGSMPGRLGDSTMSAKTAATP